MVWGSWATAGGNNIRVGVDLLLDGVVITAKYYVEMQYNASDNQTLTRTGQLAGTTNYTYSQNGGVRLIYTGTVNGKVGTSYTFGAKITGVYTGGSPSVSTSVTVVDVPGKPKAPSATAFWAPVGGGGVNAELASAPASNGASITRYDWDLSTHDFVSSDNTPGRTWSRSGLALGLATKVRVRAVNSAGAGPWSDYSGTVTVPNVPAKPAKPALVAVSSSALRGTLADAPANNGSAIDAYGWETDQGQSQVLTSGGRTWNVSGLAANTAYRVRIRARNGVAGGWGAWSDWSATVSTYPAAPAAPGKPTVTRNSDTSHGLGWARNATAPAPYASQRIERAEIGAAGWSGWATVATVAGTAEGYTDTTTVANRSYRWRVVAINPGGSAASAASNDARTTPATPSGLVAVKTAATDIGVTGAAGGFGAVTVGWQDNPGGTGWVTVAGTTSSVERTFTGVDAEVTHRYRANASVSSGTTNASTLTSAWSAPSNTVQLLTPPGAPVLKSPTSGAVNRGAAITFTWTHTSIDSSTQTAYELRYRVNGGAWTTLTGTTAQTRTVSALGVSGLLEWQVRTKGLHAEFGAWAAVVAVTLAEKPTLTLSSPDPGSPWPSGTVTVAWMYFAGDGAAQASWELRVEPEDGVGAPLTRSGTGAGASTTLGRVDNGRSYTVRVRVRAASGLWSDWALVDIDVAYALPYEAALAVLWGRADGSATLAVEQDLRSTAWLGTPGRSASVEMVDGAETRRNLATNPRLTDPYGTVSVPPIRTNRAIQPRARTGGDWLMSWGASGAGTVTYDDAFGMATCVYSAVPTAGAVSRMRCGASPGAGPHGAAVTPGETITAALSVSSNRQVRITLDYYAGTTWVAAATSAYSTVSTDPAARTRLAYTHTVPAGVDSVLVWCQVNASVVGDWLVVGQLLVGDDGLVSFFDGSGGNFALPPGQIRGWVGAVNGSASYIRWAAAADGTAPRPRALGAASAAMANGGGAISYLDGIFMAADYRQATSTASVYPCGTSGDTSGLAMARMGSGWSRWVAAGVLYSQDEPLGNQDAASRTLAVTQTAPGGAASTLTLSTPAPNVAQEDTLLTVSWYTDPAMADYALRFVGANGKASGRSRWRNLIICEGDTEAEALAKVQSYFDGGTIGTRIGVGTVDIQRQVDGGDWVTLAAGLDPLTGWTDRCAPVAGDVAWRAVTASTDGATNPGAPTVIHFRPAGQPAPTLDDPSDQVIVVAEGYLSAGPGYTDVARFVYNLDVGEPEFGLADLALHRFAGDTYATEYAGVGRVHKLGIVAVVPPRHAATTADGTPLATLPDLHRILTTARPKLWRDPDGHCLVVSVQPGASKRLGAEGHHEVTLSAERVADYRTVGS
ncbi:MAG: fibronectin type III domain-containing protein [Tessaracoccus sp.]|uniref:fibronectin type III domain-containing protein n=1 Tax=Tessaracoccus sp. TaxID=1971211 RepID=UPI001ED79ADC|nr:fibronectin type III domain-containing protein [Tessaracoccus sp.]MBK7822816.1 fibronectin type III domain-containing protein [Tessaracoccus sp.]